MLLATTLDLSINSIGCFESPHLFPTFHNSLHSLYHYLWHYIYEWVFIHWNSYQLVALNHLGCYHLAQSTPHNHCPSLTKTCLTKKIIPNNYRNLKIIP
jgi:hypothetical protein